MNRHVDVDSDAGKPSDQHRHFQPTQENTPCRQMPCHRDVDVHADQIWKCSDDDQEFQKVFARSAVAGPTEDRLKQFSKSDGQSPDQSHGEENVVTCLSRMIGTTVENDFKRGRVVGVAVGALQFGVVDLAEDGRVAAAFQHGSLKSGKWGQAGEEDGVEDEVDVKVTFGQVPFHVHKSLQEGMFQHVSQSKLRSQVN